MRCLVCGHSAAEHARRIYARKYGYRTSVACDRCECVRLEAGDQHGGADENPGRWLAGTCTQSSNPENAPRYGMRNGD